ncbi:hypothetical protein CsatB_017707 [Cannabis sativa]
MQRCCSIFPEASLIVHSRSKLTVSYEVPQILTPVASVSNILTLFFNVLKYFFLVSSNGNYRRTIYHMMNLYVLVEFPALTPYFLFFGFNIIHSFHIIDIYNLDDIVTISQLHSTIASQIHKNSHSTNPKFKLDAPYSNKEINAVRDERAKFVKPLIID